MIQKTIWMFCFSFGTLSLTDCGKKTVEPPIRTATYVYINKLNQDIFIETYGGEAYFSRKLKTGDSILYVSSGEAVFPFYYSTSVPNGTADSVRIKFADEKCTTYKFFGTLNSEQQKSIGVYNLKEYDNYSQDLVNQELYTLRYTIDSTDYKRAMPCK